MAQFTSDPSGLLLHQPRPDATTCILIGGMDKIRGLEFSRYRNLLWFVDEAGKQPPPPGIAADRIEIIAVETLVPEQTVAVVERFLRLNPRRLPSLFITEIVLKTHAAAYERIIDRTHSELEDTRRARLTRQEDGFTWQKHLLRNAPFYLNQRLPATWAGILRDIPAFVCGAGPSLETSIAPLAANADRAVIFSADSALRALALHGVSADFAVSIDAAKIPSKCLPAGSLPDRVVLSSVSPPAWQGALPRDRTFFVSSRQLTDDWLADQGAPRTLVAASESCGGTAVDLAYHLGCNPIYLFGIDLAVDPSNQAQRHHHDADPALYKHSNFDPAAKLPRVPGNYAETVPCFALGDWRALNDRLSSRADVRVFNVNDRGAALRGTTLVHPKNLSVEANPGTTKGLRLAHLTPDTSPDAAMSNALTRLQTVGERCHRARSDLQIALARGGPPALATAFRSVILDPDCGRVLGAFALKLMPHLVPPIEGDAVFWQTLLDEYAELAELAQTSALG